MGKQSVCILQMVNALCVSMESSIIWTVHKVYMTNLVPCALKVCFEIPTREINLKSPPATLGAKMGQIHSFRILHTPA